MPRGDVAWSVQLYHRVDAVVNMKVQLDLQEKGRDPRIAPSLDC